MKANEFVKKFGIGRTKYWIKEFTVINKLPDELINLDFLNELKQLVESWELVESYGGLDEAKHEVSKRPSQLLLKQAIADVESCQ